MTKLKIDMIALSDYAINDQNGKLSILGIFERIFVQAVPSNHPKAFIVASFKGVEGSKHKIELNLTSPSGKNILQAKEMEINLKEGTRFNAITEINGLPLPESGKYKFSIKEDEEILGETFFEVVKVITPSEAKKRSN